MRQAIAYGINKQRIIDKLLNGQAKPGTSELNTGYFECKDIQPFPYDAAKAKALLHEAGWKAGADGIREKGGVKLRLNYSTTSGNKLREDSQVLVVEDMKAIGVDMFIENAPSSVVIGALDGASPRRHGNFDIIMYTTNAGIDPHSQMVNLWASALIPSEAEQGRDELHPLQRSEGRRAAGQRRQGTRRRQAQGDVLRAGQDDLRSGQHDLSVSTAEDRQLSRPAPELQGKRVEQHRLERRGVVG